QRTRRVVGRSTPRVGRRTWHRCIPIRRPEKRRPPYGTHHATPVGRVVNATALATERGNGAHHNRRPGNSPTAPRHAPGQAPIVDTVLPLTEQAPVRGRRADRI